MGKRTPVFPAYAEQAKCVSFYGWELPVRFTRIREEHRAVREQAGLFDVSHMGEIEVAGTDALPFLQQMTTNDVAALNVGEAQYTVMCQADGGTIDDLLIYRSGKETYLLIVNASNVEKDMAWLTKHGSSSVKIEDQSDGYGLLAIQGPRAESILQPLTAVDLSSIRPFTFQQNVWIAGVPVWVARTGYTGEDGFELLVASEQAAHLWSHLLEAGATDGLLPCGLGARDTLRLEACLPLYGQELTEQISPIEARIGFVVNANKGNFIGREVLLDQKEQGSSRQRVGIEMVDRGIPRTGYPVWIEGKPVGKVTSGTHSPTLKKEVGLALVPSEWVTIGQPVDIEIRGKLCRAKICSQPFYRRG